MAQVFTGSLSRKSRVTNEGLYMLKQLTIDGLKERDDLPNEARAAIEKIENDCQEQRVNEPEYLREIARAYKQTAATFEEDENFKRLVSLVKEDNAVDVLHETVKKLMGSAKLTWKSVFTFFYFAYKLCTKFLTKILEILSIFAEFLKEFIVQQIINIGGWENLMNTKKWNKLMVAGVAVGIVSAGIGFYVYKQYIA